MPAKPQIPTAPQIIGPAIDKLVEARPTVVPFLDQGNWSLITTGLEGQAILAIDRLAKEAVATRLPLATDEPLTELARSEFDTLRLLESTPSVGEVSLTRRVIHYDQTIPEITIADASTTFDIQPVAVTLTSAYNDHISSAFDPLLGYGSHLTTKPRMAQYSGTLNDMSLVIEPINTLKANIIAHFSDLEMHPSADITTTILNSVPNAFASSPGNPFINNSPASQQSVYRLLNAIKRALNAHFVITAPAGVIKSGSRWSVQANPNSSPPITGAQFDSLRDVVVSIGQAEVDVQVESSINGLNGNTPLWISGGQNRQIIAQDVLFDSTQTEKFAISDFRAAGGIDAETDEVLRKASKSKFRGKSGPTNNAIIAGCFDDGRIAHASTLEELEFTGIAYAYVADYSWAQSKALLNQIKQNLRDNWEGAGCKILMGDIRNKLIRVDLTVAVKDAKLLADTDDIADDIKVDLLDYFENRDDFYLWTFNNIKSVVSKSNRNILTCLSATVKDENGIVLSEPVFPVAGETLIHYWLLDNAINIIFTSPV